MTSHPVPKYAQLAIGDPGLIVGGKDPSKDATLEAYPSVAGPQSIANVETDEDWRQLLDRITAALAQEFPDCSLVRSPGPVDARADWQIRKDHPRGFGLVLEVVATRRRSAVHIDSRRFVWRPRSMMSIVGLCIGCFSVFLGLLLLAAKSWLGALAIWPAGLGFWACAYFAPHAVTPDVDSQSQSMLLAANAAIGAAE